MLYAKSPENINALKEIPSGLIVGLVAALLTISYAQVIFHTPAINLLPLGIPAVYLGSIILVLIVSYFGSAKEIIAGPSHGFIIISSVMVGHLAIALKTMTGVNPLPTIMTALSFMAMITGIWLFLLGRFNLGNMIRFIPYPVMCGFMASLGWILLQAGGSSVVNQEFSWKYLLHPGSITLLSIGAMCLAYAIAMRFILGNNPNPLLLILLLVLAFFVFYIFLWIKGIPLQNALDMGLMIKSFKSSSYLHELISPTSWQQIQWHLLWGTSRQYLSLIVIASIAFMLKMSSFELLSKKDVAINHDLKTVGTASFIAGLIAGIQGYIDPVLTQLNMQLRSITTVPAIITAMIYAFVLFAPIPVLDYIPRYVVAVVIFYLAIELLAHWLIKPFKALSYRDYGIIIAILLIATNVDLFTGILAGLIISMLSFLFSYSNVNIIKLSNNSRHVRSRVERNEVEMALLKKEGEQCYILVLQNFLFFGNTYPLYEQSKKILQNQSKAIKYLVIDYYRVTGIDSSATLGLLKVCLLAEKFNFEIFLTGLKPKFNTQIKAVIPKDALAKVNMDYSNIDYALEWIEDQIIAQNTVETSSVRIFPNKLKEILSEIHKRMPLFTTKYFEINETIYTINQVADGFYYIESGIVDILLPSPKGKEVRLRSVHAGNIIGEMGVFLNLRRTATVRAHQPCTVVPITIEGLMQLEQKYPQLALALHKEIITLLCKRLQYTNLLTLDT